MVAFDVSFNRGYRVLYLFDLIFFIGKWLS